MKNHQIEYIFFQFHFRIVSLHKSKIHKTNMRKSSFFFLFFLCFFWDIFFLCAQKKRQKKEKSLAKLSANITLFIFLSRLNCLCGFIYSVSIFFCFGVFFHLSAKYQNRFYYVSSMNTFHVDINRKQMSIEGGSGWRRMVRKIEAWDI